MKKPISALIAAVFLSAALPAAAHLPPQTKAGSEEGRLKQAEADIDAGRGDAAVKALLPLAEAGDAEAQALLGKAYYLGRGVEKDEQKALFWDKKAAENV